MSFRVVSRDPTISNTPNNQYCEDLYNGAVERCDSVEEILSKRPFKTPWEEEAHKKEVNKKRNEVNALAKSLLQQCNTTMYEIMSGNNKPIKDRKLCKIAVEFMALPDRLAENMEEYKDEIEQKRKRFSDQEKKIFEMFIK